MQLGDKLLNIKDLKQAIKLLLTLLSSKESVNTIQLLVAPLAAQNSDTIIMIIHKNININIIHLLIRNQMIWVRNVVANKQRWHHLGWVIIMILLIKLRKLVHHLEIRVAPRICCRVIIKLQKILISMVKHQLLTIITTHSNQITNKQQPNLYSTPAEINNLMVWININNIKQLNTAAVKQLLIHPQQKVQYLIDQGLLSSIPEQPKTWIKNHTLVGKLNKSVHLIKTII